MKNSRSAFTLIEILIAVVIFATVATVVGSTYIKSIRVDSSSNLARQLYDDTRFVMSLIEGEIRSGAIDYDEYYSRNVVLGAVGAGALPPGVRVDDNDPNLYYESIHTADTYGLHFGRYYSSFYHPGSDNLLGYLCNNNATRNDPNCTPLRNTLDRNTGQNPYLGKNAGAVPDDENAFCGAVYYGQGAVNRQGQCAAGGAPAVARPQPELYLISADAKRKTLLAREVVGPLGTRALSLLRLSGIDNDGDGLSDLFTCAPEFDCRGGENIVGYPPPPANDQNFADCGVSAGETPRAPGVELTILDAGANCENTRLGFNKDFVPISPLRIDIQRLDFHITPVEDPHYAFAEEAVQQQPMVTIVLTVAPSPDYASAIDLDPVTFIKTVMVGVESPIPAPVKVTR